MRIMTTKLFASSALVAVLSTAAFADAPAAVTEAEISAILTDAEDGNRFFTRLGGSANETLSYSGLEGGAEYVLTTSLVNAETGEAIETVETPFVADAAGGELVVNLPVPRNETDYNIDYVTTNVLRMANADTPLMEMTGEAADPERAIQVHSIQRLNVISAVDAADGDNRIEGEGGQIDVTVGYENMVEGYKYTIWGQLLTESGQSRGVFASEAEFIPDTKAGELTLTFDVPAGFDGTSVVPSVGVYHQNRVEIREDGNLVWLEGAANPVMIASSTDLDNADLTVEVGVPFGQTE